MKLDQGAYNLHLALARRELSVVFDESKHPRLHGRFVRGLHEGLTGVKGKVTKRVNDEGWMPDTRELAGPLKAVEHKKINKLARDAGHGGTPIPKNTDPFHKPGEPFSPEHDLSRVDYLMSQSTTQRDMTVLRAVPATEVANKKVGDEFVEHGFVSTSKTAEGNKHFTDAFSTYAKGKTKKAYMKITVPKGTPAHDYGPKDKDHELVLDRGLRFRVTGEESTPEGEHVLLVEVVK
jgi:hypothetical protein